MIVSIGGMMFFTFKYLSGSAKRIFGACVCLAPLCFSGAAHAASAEDFRTPEYLTNGQAYDWVRAAEAYALGFSGQGVTVGVLDDSAAREHPEFAGKALYLIREFSASNFVSSHGVHTAGTVLAVKDGDGMHGIAWGSNPVSMVGLDDTPKSLAAFLDYPQVSIINNSWGSEGLFLADFIDLEEGEEDDLKESLEEDFLALGRLADERDILLVFAAGNEGHVFPGIPASLPSIVLGAETASGYVEQDAGIDWGFTKKQRRALSLNMISVSAFDPFVDSSASLAFIAAFSNMADGATDYTLLAPGMDIFSSVYTGSKLYDHDSGTSMAAPIVSGVAALVKEAFPFMGGKQLADVLLSTATPIAGDDRPPFLVLRRQEVDPEDEEQWKFALNVIAPDSLAEDDGTVKQAIVVMLGSADHVEIARLAKLFGYGDIASFISEIETALEGGPGDPSDSDATFFILESDTYNRLFGMGIVNAYAAVRGPGWLDAHRLNDEDKKRYGVDNYAMYPVDTKGYNAIWSNDIGQVKVGDALYPDRDFGPSYIDPEDNEFFGELDGLDVGLVKSGAGTLFLAGNNKYCGPTVVAGGEISLGIAGQAEGTASLEGGVYVEKAGTFSGNGLVSGDLDFKGLLSPGFFSTQGNLTVQGSVTGGGELFSRIWADGRVNKLVVGQDSPSVNLEGTLVRLSDLAGGHALPASRYQLVESENGTLTGTLVNDTAVSRQGVTLLHEFQLFSDVQGLYAEIFRTFAAPEAKALSEGFLAGLSLVNLGADLVAGQGITDAAKAAKRADAEAGLGAFGVLSVGKLRYNTGSHVDMSSISLMTGFSLGRNLKPGHLTLGTFFEYGKGSYDTYNSFSNAASVHGDGDTHHIGGGVLGRMDFINTGPGHFYGEASGRGGKVHNEYDSSDLRDVSGSTAEYDSSSAYYGFHLGTGYVWNITGAASLDLYGKYFWTRQEGDSVRLSTGDPVTFKDADSSRLRLGSRFACTLNEYVSPYFGAAWEYEFDGKARAEANGYSIKAPELKGVTGIGELGFSLQPSVDSGLSFDLGVQGYTGVREGVAGSFQIIFKF